jgi:carbon-monoxide dehydrogenase medium subunit
MKAAAFTHHLPRSTGEAAALLADVAPDGGRIIAGGQTLVAIMALRLAQPPHLIDINAIPGLDHVIHNGGILHIGALVRHSAMHRLPPAIPGAALLARIAGHIAHLPIRNRGTVCGSLAYADPAAEWGLVLAALDGAVTAHSRRGRRLIPAADYFQGIMTTALAEDELIVEAQFTLPPPGTACGFHEVSRRAGDYAMAMALVSYRLEAGRIAAPCIAIGGAEAFPRRLPGAEAALHGASPTTASFRHAADQAAAEIDPITDGQVDAGLRRDLVRAVIHRALQQAAAGA